MKFRSIALESLRNRDFNNSALFISGELFGGLNVFANGDANVGQRLFLG